MWEGVKNANYYVITQAHPLKDNPQKSSLDVHSQPVEESYYSALQYSQSNFKITSLDDSVESMVGGSRDVPLYANSRLPSFSI